MKELVVIIGTVILGAYLRTDNGTDPDGDAGGQAMKEMITAISSLFILSIFVLQFAVNQNLAVKTAISGAECYRLAEEAGGDGKNYEETVKCRMADIWQCDKDEACHTE